MDEKVGIQKRLAITAGIGVADAVAAPLKSHLRNDPAIIPLDHMTIAELARRRLTRVFVNGEWIGCCTNAHKFVSRHLSLCREGRAPDSHTKIYWALATGDIEFWLEADSPSRP